MGRAMNRKPITRVGLVFTKFIAHLGMEYLRATTWHTSQTGVNQLPQNLCVGSFGQMGEPIDFDRRPAFQVQARIFVVQYPNDI